MTDIPMDATVSINVRSITKGLRDIALLNDRGSLDTTHNLEMLADRIEQMYKEQNENPATVD